MRVINVQIFISYRREDAAAEAGRIYSTIRQAFGEHLVFMDTRSIPLGDEWPEEIQVALRAAKTVILVIGPAWLRSGSSEWGQRRIDQESDWVRRELSLAFRENKIVIPVLVREARMPPAEVLPEDINALSNRQKFDIRNDYWDHDIKLLRARLQGLLPKMPWKASQIFQNIIVLTLLAIAIFATVVVILWKFPHEPIVDIDAPGPAEVMSNAEHFKIKVKGILDQSKYSK